MDKNEELYQSASDAIMALFNDQNVPDSVTIENLESLIDEINTAIDAIKLDMEKDD